LLLVDRNHCKSDEKGEQERWICACGEKKEKNSLQIGERDLGSGFENIPLAGGGGSQSPSVSKLGAGQSPIKEDGEG